MSTTEAGRLPAFVGIGALKAGTTFLDGLLRTHPQLCLPQGVKEVDYFSLHYGRGPRWYASRFDGCGTRLHGEISPRYLVEPRVPERLVSANPAVRVLLTVRDPVDRAYSQYKHRIRTTGYRRDFDDYLAENPGALDRGSYARHLRRYLDHVRREAVLVLVFDDLVAAPDRVLAEVARFLGVDDACTRADTSQTRRPSEPTPRNESWQPSRRRLFVVAKTVSRRLHDMGLGRVATAVSGTGAVRVLSGEPRPMSVPPMTPATTERLRAYYEADVDGLSELLGRDLRQLWWASRKDRVP